MTKYFMAGTPHAGFEIMMMLPPKRQPALAAGHSYKPGDCDCRYCIEAERKRCFWRKASGCVCFGERFAAGYLTHGELAESLGSDAAMKGLSGRISRLLPPQTLTPFADEAHRKRLAFDRDEIITFSSYGLCGITQADMDASKKDKNDDTQ